MVTSRPNEPDESLVGSPPHIELTITDDYESSLFELYPDKAKKLIEKEIGGMIRAFAKTLEGRRKITIKNINLEHNKGKVSKVQVKIDNI